MRTTTYLRSLAILGALISAPDRLHAYEYDTSTNGNTVRWGVNSPSFYINPAGSLAIGLAKYTDFENAVGAAMRTWNNVTGSRFKFKNAGRTKVSAYGVYDGVNRIDIGPLGSASIAEAHVWSLLPSGEIVDTDLRFNNSYKWSGAGTPPVDKYDVQNIATHELGHCLGLADLYDRSLDTEKTMYGKAVKGETKKRTLHTDDILGLRFLYPSSN